jgi:hypothetical protein
MDEAQFDDLARTLVETRSRRRMIGAIAGGICAAVGFGGGTAAEQGKGKGKQNKRRPRPCERESDCGECGTCQQGVCVPFPDRCTNCQTCDPRTLTCKGGCKQGKVCCAGTCEHPGRDTCCASSDQCGDRCWRCNHLGLCEPNPNPIECGDCKRCQNGSCSADDPELLCGDVCCGDSELCTGVIFRECCPIPRICAGDCCEEGEKCTQEDGCCPRGKQCGAGPGGQFDAKSCCDDDETCVDGECCPTERVCDGGRACCRDGHVCNRRTDKCCLPCVDGRCCPGRAVCIDDGILGNPNSCCAPPYFGCGENGDGSFRHCCLRGVEACIDGACKSCPDARPLCGRECCEADETCRNGRCVVACPDGQLTANGVCCPNGPACGDTCCDAGQRCCGGVCRPDCGGRCCPAGQVCRNNQCRDDEDQCPFPDWTPCPPVENMCCPPPTKCCPPALGVGICCSPEDTCCPTGGCCEPGWVCAGLDANGLPTCRRP